MIEGLLDADHILDASEEALKIADGGDHAQHPSEIRLVSRLVRLRWVGFRGKLRKEGGVLKLK